TAAKVALCLAHDATVSHRTGELEALLTRAEADLQGRAGREASAKFKRVLNSLAQGDPDLFDILRHITPTPTVGETDLSPIHAGLAEIQRIREARWAGHREEDALIDRLLALAEKNGGSKGDLFGAVLVLQAERALVNGDLKEAIQIIARASATRLADGYMRDPGFLDAGSRLKALRDF